MILLAVSTLLSFLSVHSKFVSNPIIKWLYKNSQEEESHIDEINKLKLEQQKLNMIDDFAKYSKIQRKINKLTEHLEERQNSKNSNSFYVKVIFPIALRVAFAAILVALSISYRNVPVLYLSNSINLFPFGHIVSFPNGGNTVSVHFWVMCCTATAKLINL